MKQAWKNLNSQIIDCCRCPRLVSHREEVLSSKGFQMEPHWRRPVPGFGDHEAWLLLVGLAPSSQGANRTGRAFTGDGSARFLIPCLWKAGLANQPTSEEALDGLQLIGCFITASVKCVPPKHKPLKTESENCFPYLIREFELLSNLKAIVALGRDGYKSVEKLLQGRIKADKFPPFAHGRRIHFEQGLSVYASYHPSPQNTQTGLLTEEMFLGLLSQVKKDSNKSE